MGGPEQTMHRKTFNLLSLVALLPLSGAFAAESTSVRDTRLVNAVKSGNSAAAIALLQKRADPNIAEPDGTAPIHWAIRNDDVALVDRLIRAGANATAANRYGVTPISLACESGSAAIVERLLKAGVSANATGPQGETALHTCARAGKTDAAKVLICTRGVDRRWRELARSDTTDVGCCSGASSDDADTH